jgi:hypothetical protein
MLKKSSQFALVKHLVSFGLQLTPVLPARHAILSFPPATHDSHKYRQLTITAFALFAWFSTETISTFAAGSRFYEKVREIQVCRPVFVSVHRGVLRQASFKKLLDLCGKRAVLYFTSEKERET